MGRTAYLLPLPLSRSWSDWTGSKPPNQMPPSWRPTSHDKDVASAHEKDLFTKTSGTSSLGSGLTTHLLRPRPYCALQAFSRQVLVPVPRLALLRNTSTPVRSSSCLRSPPPSKRFHVLLALNRTGFLPSRSSECHPPGGGPHGLHLTRYDDLQILIRSGKSFSLGL